MRELRSYSSAASAEARYHRLRFTPAGARGPQAIDFAVDAPRGLLVVLAVRRHLAVLLRLVIHGTLRPREGAQERRSEPRGGGGDRD